MAIGRPHGSKTKRPEQRPVPLRKHNIDLCIADTARAHGILTPIELHYRTRISHVTILQLWNNSPAADPLLSTLGRIATAIGVSVRDLLVEEAVAPVPVEALS